MVSRRSLGVLAHASCQEVHVSYITKVKLYFLSNVDGPSKNGEVVRATCSCESPAKELSFEIVVTP